VRRCLIPLVATIVLMLMYVSVDTMASCCIFRAPLFLFANFLMKSPMRDNHETSATTFARTLPRALIV
jgi:hypothetical protein